jgi:hypothetical protein
MNREWHLKHKMPKNPTPEQRRRWHEGHARNCDCRPVPRGLGLKVRVTSRKGGLS